MARWQGTTESRFWDKVNKDGPVPVHASELGPCWVWTAYCDRFGYGHSRFDGRVWSAHRISWTLINGPIPDGLWVLHACDNPPCVNPAHLWLGTAADNAHDRDRKGRQVPHFGDRNGSRLHPDRVPRGDRHGSRTHPERVPRGDRNGARTHPERVARGDRNGSRLHPESLARGDRHGSRIKPEGVPRGESHGNARLTEAIVREIRTRRKAGDSLRTIADDLGVCEATVGHVMTGRTWKHVK